MRVVLLLLAAASAAAADNLVTDPGAPFPTTIDMPRSTAMGGAHAAIASGNDALVVNPAGMSQNLRYHFELDGAWDGRFPAQGVLASLVDTKSTPVGSGILFSRWGSGQPAGRGEGWLLGFAYSYPAGNFLIGGESKYVRFHGPDGLTARWAQDIGLLAKRGSLSYALVVQNIALKGIPLFPLTATAGIALGSDTDWHIAFDYKADLSDLQNVRHKAALGVEYLLEQTVALRAGGTYDPTAKLGWISAGFAVLAELGSVQVSVRRRVQGGFDQVLEGGITIFLE